MTKMKSHDFKCTATILKKVSYLSNIFFSIFLGQLYDFSLVVHLNVMSMVSIMNFS